MSLQNRMKKINQAMMSRPKGLNVLQQQYIDAMLDAMEKLPEYSKLEQALDRLVYSNNPEDKKKVQDIYLKLSNKVRSNVMKELNITPKQLLEMFGE